MEQVRAETKRALTNVAAEGQRHIARYPPQRLTKTGYRRTGTLKRSWSFKVSATGNKLFAEVGSNSNIAPYNKFVQGEQGQRVFMFQGVGWKNIDQLQKMMENDFVKEFEQILRRAVT